MVSLTRKEILQTQSLYTLVMFYFDVVFFLLMQRTKRKQQFDWCFKQKPCYRQIKNSLSSIRRFRDELGQRAHCFVTQVYTCTNEITHSLKFKCYLNFLNTAFP